MNAATQAAPGRKDHRIILHADYDAFYSSVFEAENPALRALPLAVQQKFIIVTCNYEARRRGLHKLQLISEAKKLCPEVIIVVGEELGRFRDASKALYRYLEAFTWNKKVEKLGFDEVFLDVSDIITYNQALLNPNDLKHTFFQLSRDDPAVGFLFDATEVAGYQYLDISEEVPLPKPEDLDLFTRLMLGSHLAHHIRLKLEEDKGYTSTFGVSTSKLLSKLVGNVHKPKAQTTLMPPYSKGLALASEESQECLNLNSANLNSNVTSFIDAHEIRKIPGIGFKMSQIIRSHVLARPADFDKGLIYGETKEFITVGDVRLYPGMGPELLEKLLGGPGAEKGIGSKIWNLINGVDDSEVREAKKVPSQLSIEDSYIRLDTMPQIYKELRMLTTSLIKRMHVDLLEDDEDGLEPALFDQRNNFLGKRWIAHPKTIKLTTRPRPPSNPDGSRTRSFNRISRSGPLPNFIFNLREGVNVIVEKLVQETLVPMFHRLHPEKQGWNLSLMNIGVTNMAEAASEDGSGGGRDIGRMFKHQNEVLKEWKVEDKDIPPDEIRADTDGVNEPHNELVAEPSASDEVMDDEVYWEGEEDIDVPSDKCSTCGAAVPAFAMAAHERYHVLGDR